MYFGGLLTMTSELIANMFLIGCILFLVGAIVPFFTYRNPTYSNTISGIASCLASAIILFASIYKLLFLNDISINFDINTNIPFLSVSFNIDNLSTFFISIISLLSLIVSVYSFGYMKHYYYRRNICLFSLFYNTFILTLLLLVSSSNLLLFLILWELMALTSYFLVIYEHDKDDVQKSGRIYIIMTHIGTAFIIAAFSMIAYYGGSFELANINASQIPTSSANIIFIFLTIGFGTKAGIFPLHIWLPSAHPVAPSNISALMSGVMIKMSVYGLLRVLFDIFEGNAYWWGIVLLVLGFVSAILGISYAVVSTVNIKRMLAYSSIENMGIIFCGIGIMLIARAADNPFLLAISLTITLLHTLNHSIFKSLLFMGAGAIQVSAGTKNIEKLGGLIKKMPIASLFILIGCLAISAVPPFNGFLSEYMIFQTLISGITYFLSISKLYLAIILLIAAIVLALTGALVAYCFVKLFGIAFLGVPRSTSSKNAVESDKSMLAALGIGSVLCVILGVFPKLIIYYIDKISQQLIGSSLFDSSWSLSKLPVYPIGSGKLELSILGISAVLLICGAIVVSVILILRKRTSITRYSTWDCGFQQLNCKMQYTGIGFSKPLTIIFRGLFKPSREMSVIEGEGPYFVKSGVYKISTVKVFEKYLYIPIVKFFINFSRKMRFSVQTGSVHTYLFYFFAALIVMLVYFIIN